MANILRRIVQAVTEVPNRTVRDPFYSQPADVRRAQRRAASAAAGAAKKAGIASRRALADQDGIAANPAGNVNPDSFFGG